MKLDDGHGSTFAFHFYHGEDKILAGNLVQRGWRFTACAMHLGPCAKKERPCGTKDAVVGVARCRPTDNFDALEGRKLAFARALVHAKLSYEQRVELWRGYFTKTKVRHRTMVDKLKDENARLKAALAERTP